MKKYSKHYMKWTSTKKIIDLIKSLYKEQQSAVQLECGTTEWFPVSKGVRQGCILSPYLFSLYTKGIIKDVEWLQERWIWWAKNKGLPIQDLRYTDDTALLSTIPRAFENLKTLVKKTQWTKGAVPNC